MSSFTDGQFMRSCSERLGEGRRSLERLWKQRSHVSLEKESMLACEWLRMAGFPQYAQMYTDKQFPIDVVTVEVDHGNLGKEMLRPLYRRLNTLNLCAKMKLDTSAAALKSDAQDEENLFAFSENWNYQPSLQHWLHITEPTEPPRHPPRSPPASPHFTLGSSDEPNEPTTFSEGWRHQRRPTPRSSPALSGWSSCEFGGSSGHSAANDSGNDWSAAAAPGAGAQTKRATRAGVAYRRRGGSDSNLLQLDRPATPNRERPADAFRDRARALLSQLGGGLKRRSVSDLVGLCKSPSFDAPPSAERKSWQLSCVDLPAGDRDLEGARGSGGGGGGAAAEMPAYSPGHPVTKSEQHKPRGKSKYRKKAYGGKGRSTSDTLFLGYGRESVTPGDPRDSPRQQTPAVPLLRTQSRPLLVAPPSPPTRADLLNQSYSLAQRRSGRREERRGDKREETKQEWDVADPQPSYGKKASGVEDATDAPWRCSVYDNVSLPVSVTYNPAYEGRQLQPSKDDDLMRSINELNSVEESIASLCKDLENLQEAMLNKPEKERRDSGIGASLTLPSDLKGRVRWHNFTKFPTVLSSLDDVAIESLTVGQVMVLQKLSLLRLTTLLESYSQEFSRLGWNWSAPKLKSKMKKLKYSEFRGKMARLHLLRGAISLTSSVARATVFGVPLAISRQQQLGQPLPRCILSAMRHLVTNELDCDGLFRKPGVRSHIQRLHCAIEANPDMNEFDGYQAYCIADTIKQYFRELPDSLMTAKLSQTFVTIASAVPEEQRLEAMKGGDDAAHALMKHREACPHPAASSRIRADEHRRLSILLQFLYEVTQRRHVNQMTAHNLAVCLAPSLFQIGSQMRSSSTSPIRGRRGSHGAVPDQRELVENRAACDCLALMIVEQSRLFTVAPLMLFETGLSAMQTGEPASLQEMEDMGAGGQRAHVDACVQGLLKECQDNPKCKGWVLVAAYQGVDIFCKALADGYPLKLWRCTIETEAPPLDVLSRLLWGRQTWDKRFVQWRITEKLDRNSDIFQYVEGSDSPLSPRDYCVFRSWKTDLPKETCSAVITSVSRPEEESLADVRGVVLASRYLIKPCGSGRSKIMHFCRVDTRGRSADWHNNFYGYQVASQLLALARSFDSHVVRCGETNL
ncbi:PREDICTED: LOW QUALITY PROTEIN: stAR-related lipid transfer protein 13-like [Priapulus caudatus]|uniref:LOW QUALITY PROTEIN: stAR-related lipid transfer protein 13-like n=1 Tax=Priapulus caudatus TaxID=37621 RepID=A0ABM1DT34_PRICU|nr:PREDICTED: LOW QUALITY PROTEIN: stAR-related lipid transfer protein 13-like [Priapulus caudatus]